MFWETGTGTRPNAALVLRGESSHTRSMTPKNSAFLAFIATLLLSVLLLWRLVVDILNVMQGVAPALALLSSLIYAFSAVSVTVFFFTFQSRQT